MVAALNLFDIQPAALEIDGSIEQRDELAAVAVELYRQLRGVRDNYNRVASVLQSAMTAAGEKKRVCDGYELKLVPVTEYWCASHHQPPAYCRSKHADGDVEVFPVACEPELRINAA